MSLEAGCRESKEIQGADIAISESLKVVTTTKSFMVCDAWIILSKSTTATVREVEENASGMHYILALGPAR